MPASPDPMRGPRLKIERANAHIREATAIITEVVDADPKTLYEIFTENDIGLTQQSMKLKFLGRVPDTLVPVVGDAIGNLRSALDHVVGQLALQNGATDTKFVSYPFAATREEFEGPKTKAKIKKLSAEAQSYLLGLETYKGGKGQIFWAMNELRQLDFHNGIVPVAASTLRLQSTFTMRAGSTTPKIFSAPKTGAFDENMTMTLLTYPFPQPGQEIEAEFATTIGMAFGDVEIVKGQSVVEVLQQFSNYTTALVMDVEIAFFKN